MRCARPVNSRCRTILAFAQAISLRLPLYGCPQSLTAIYTARHSSRESRVAIDIHWIRDNDSLGQFCAQWQQLPFVALDTDFIREIGRASCRERVCQYV